MFYWKRFHVDIVLVKEIQRIYKQQLPNNNFFFQQLNLPVTHFLDREVQRFVLIQVEPYAMGRIHTDYRPPGYGDKLALQIPLENCDESTTHIWESDYTPPVQYTSNRQPYNFYDPARCKKITSFNLTEPTFFRTDLPHSVDNPTGNVRKAISIRFKKDPWDLIGESYE